MNTLHIMSLSNLSYATYSANWRICQILGHIHVFFVRICSCRYFYCKQSKKKTKKKNYKYLLPGKRSSKNPKKTICFFVLYFFYFVMSNSICQKYKDKKLSLKLVQEDVSTTKMKKIYI